MRLEYLPCPTCRDYDRSVHQVKTGCWVCGWSQHLPVAMAVEVALVGAHPATYPSLESAAWANTLRALRVRYGLPEYPDNREHQDAA